MRGVLGGTPPSFSRRILHKKEHNGMKLTYELRPGIDQVGYVDYNVRDFHSYDTRLGATYNAYLIRDEKVALVDTVKAPFAQQLQRNVASLVELEKVDYLICLHAEMDHSGALPAMVKACPNAVVVCNAKCKEALAGFYDVSDWKFQIVAQGESLSLRPAYRDVEPLRRRMRPADASPRSEKLLREHRRALRTSDAQSPRDGQNARTRPNRARSRRHVAVSYQGDYRRV